MRDCEWRLQEAQEAVISCRGIRRRRGPTKGWAGNGKPGEIGAGVWRDNKAQGTELEREGAYRMLTRGLVP